MKMIGLVDWAEDLVDLAVDLLETYTPIPDYHPDTYSGVHTGYNLYAHLLEVEFAQIRAFQVLFPKEIVIIDLNGDWNEMTDKNYRIINDRIKLM